MTEQQTDPTGSWIPRPPAPAKPSLADQAALIDAVEVAARIAAQGARGAIGASTVEIAAMAHRLLQLTMLADLTFKLLLTADAALAETRTDVRRTLNAAVRLEVSDVGFALEALGYGQNEPITSTKEKPHGSENQT